MVLSLRSAHAGYKKIDCEKSPIQTTFLGAHPEECSKLITSPPFSAVIYYRQYTLIGGFSNIHYGRASLQSFYKFLSAKKILRGYSEVKKNATNWEDESREKFGERPYIIQRFDLSGGTNCMGFVWYGSPRFGGYQEILFGYMCNYSGGIKNKDLKKEFTDFLEQLQVHGK
jgi:hypothetical protein